MHALRKAIFALCLIAGAAFAAASFAQPAMQPAAPEKAAPAPAAKPAKPKPAPKAAPLIDINTASEQELRSLKGVGDVRAAAIIKNRPYKGKDELVQKNILPQGVYDGIKDKIIAKQH
ncbi:MAG: helix-hairpin-helix domain-containing protein [Methylocapsa sp.]|nr:helix-hairpin-helix domain-containing protein [Methylocapsa sp.]